jgi:TRAP-type C4-dicarboxylate transport system permease small subunit
VTHLSRPDRGADVAVDFAPPRQRSLVRPLATLLVAVLIAGLATVAVTQLLLR